MQSFPMIKFRLRMGMPASAKNDCPFSGSQYDNCGNKTPESFPASTTVTIALPISFFVFCKLHIIFPDLPRAAPSDKQTRFLQRHNFPPDTVYAPMIDTHQFSNLQNPRFPEHFPLGQFPYRYWYRGTSAS